VSRLDAFTLKGAETMDIKSRLQEIERLESEVMELSDKKRQLNQLQTIKVNVRVLIDLLYCHMETYQITELLDKLGAVPQRKSTRRELLQEKLYSAGMETTAIDELMNLVR
jgi:hypothetical protein